MVQNALPMYSSIILRKNLKIYHRDLLPVNIKIDYPHIYIKRSTIHIYNVYTRVYMWIVDLFIDREQVPVDIPKRESESVYEEQTTQ